MHKVYLGLGSNMSNPLKQLKDAIFSINNIENTSVQKKSNVYESLPVGYLNQPNFFNQVISIETDLLPKKLLQHFQEIEKKQKLVYMGHDEAKQEADKNLKHNNMKTKQKLEKIIDNSVKTLHQKYNS